MARRPIQSQKRLTPITRFYLQSLITLSVAMFMLAGCGGGTEQDAGSSASGNNSAALQWDAAAASNVSNYRVYYGTVSGTYFQARGSGINTGGATSYTVTGLASQARYYFAITAVNTSGDESGFSNEVFKDIP